MVSYSDKMLQRDVKRILFPSPLEVWVVSYSVYAVLEESHIEFPAPLEVWVVSYVSVSILLLLFSTCFQPLSRLG